MRVCKFTGGELPANLFNDARGRENIYRYRTPQRSDVLIRLPYEQAVAKAISLNKKRAGIPSKRFSVTFWAEEYIEAKERLSPDINSRGGWKNQKSQLRGFAREFAKTPTNSLDIAFLTTWWNSLTYDMQHNRRPTLSKFFQFLMGQGVAASNPFNSTDTAPHLMKRGKPKKRRRPLHLAEFWKVYEHAPQFLRDAMAISLATTLRRGDIVNLRFEDIVDGRLRVTIGKSVGQRGFARASHLAWNLDDHPMLKDVVNASRERSLTLLRCPYIVAHKPAKARKRPTANHGEHRYKTREDALSKAFTAARKASGLWDSLRPGEVAPSFHEIRGLAIERMLAAGETLSDVQHIAAHTDESVTSAYAANHAPEYQTVGIATPVEKPG